MAKEKTASDVSKMIKDHDVKLVDFKFCDLPGTWQHFTTTLTEYNEDIFTEGLGFDGSSIRGWKVINASDMLVIPDPTTAWIDIFNAEPTLSLICTIADPITREPYDRDPRGIAEKAEAFLKSTGIADTAFFGPEAEFFIFDEVRFSYAANSSFHLVDSVEGHWNSAREEFPNLGYKIRPKEGYFPVSPMDTLQDIRNEMCLELEKAGVAIEKQHHEVATAGQAEIDIHMSLWKDGKPLFAGNGYGGLSELALFFIGGILQHAPALTCITNPTTNSYKRLVPGFEAPVNLAYSARNRSAAIRIPTYSASPKAKRIEFRTPDASANPYIAFSALLLAGLDGIQNRIDPGDPLDKNLYELPPEELAQIASVPDSLRGAIEALQADHSFLLKGDVFNADFIANWIDMKQKEYDALRLRPHPYEFAMYYDV
jgi:glutamine synthetase